MVISKTTSINISTSKLAFRTEALILKVQTYVSILTPKEEQELRPKHLSQDQMLNLEIIRGAEV